LDAWNRNVLLLSPSTLLFVARREAHSRNVREIANRETERYDNFVGFVEDMNSLRTRLKQLQSDHDDADSRLSTGRGNLVGQAQKLRQLGCEVVGSCRALRARAQMRVWSHTDRAAENSRSTRRMGRTAGCGSQANAVLALRCPALQRDCAAGNKVRLLVSSGDNANYHARLIVRKLPTDLMRLGNE
jgi:RmuC family